MRIFKMRVFCVTLFFRFFDRLRHFLLFLGDFFDVFCITFFHSFVDLFC